jgi:Fur family ferric uptake transcriptional regulator
MVNGMSQTVLMSEADWQMLDSRLTQAGLRRTRATRLVLGVLTRDPAWSPTHAEIETVLAQTGDALNRVTLYRLLDRLVSVGVLQRHVDESARTWRYRWSTPWPPASHPSTPELGPDPCAVVPRFECDACHRQFRLTEASPSSQVVAEQLLQTLANLGHHGERVDVAIHGTCAVCVEPTRGGAAAHHPIG